MSDALDPIEAFADRVAREVEASDRARVRHRLDIVMRECEMGRRGKRLVGRLEAALARRGIEADPPIAEAVPGESVTFRSSSRTAAPAPKQPSGAPPARQPGRWRNPAIAGAGILGVCSFAYIVGTVLLGARSEAPIATEPATAAALPSGTRVSASLATATPVHSATSAAVGVVNPRPSDTPTAEPPETPTATSAAPPSSTPRPTVTPASEPLVATESRGFYDHISAGNCFNAPGDPNDTARVVPCSRPHDAEMIAKDIRLRITDPDAPYPDDDTWLDLGDEYCWDTFIDYTGVNPGENGIDISFIYPLEEDWWDVSGRLISCAIQSVDSTRLTGSAKR